MPEMVRRLEISVGWETLLADLNRRLEVGDSHEIGDCDIGDCSVCRVC